MKREESWLVINEKKRGGRKAGCPTGPWGGGRMNQVQVIMVQKASDLLIGRPLSIVNEKVRPEPCVYSSTFFRFGDAGQFGKSCWFAWEFENFICRCISHRDKINDHTLLRGMYLYGTILLHEFFKAQEVLQRNEICFQSNPFFIIKSPFLYYTLSHSFPLLLFIVIYCRIFYSKNMFYHDPTFDNRLLKIWTWQCNEDASHHGFLCYDWIRLSEPGNSFRLSVLGSIPKLALYEDSGDKGCDWIGLIVSLPQLNLFSGA